MKKIIFPLALLAAVPLMFSSCNNQSDGGDDNQNPVVEFEGFHYKVVALAPDSLSGDGPNGNLCEISGQGILPKKIGSQDITFLRDSLCRLAEIDYVDRKLVNPVLEEGLQLTEKNPAETESCGVKVNELSVDLVTPQLVVWKDYYYFYPCGAAHGGYNTTYVNYSILKGEILKLEDIFKPGYQSELLPLIRRGIEEQNLSLLVDLEEIDIPSDFRITTHTIEFIYSLYEIAPYSEGEIRVELPRYEIDDLFAPGAEELLFGTNLD